MSLTQWQLEAIPFAAEKAGEWMEECATSTDFSKISYDEWMCFIEAICIAYDQKIAECRGDGKAPF